MATIVFSDTHLTDKFEVRKFEYLKKIISLSDRVIINGDFFDGYIVKFNRFVESKWRRLFPILKEKKAVYLFGNHDLNSMCDERVKLFSQKQLERYRIVISGKVLRIEHGNRIAPAADERFPWRFLPKTRLTTEAFLLAREELPVKFIGKKLFVTYKGQNQKMKKWVKNNLAKNEILVCSHSHLAEFDLESKYINTGVIRHGYGQYLRIEGEKMTLIDEKY